VSILLQHKEVVHSEDKGLSDDECIKSLKVDSIVVEKGDDGFKVDKGEEGIVMVKDVKVQVEVVYNWEKKLEVANSLQSLRVSIKRR